MRARPFSVAGVVARLSLALPLAVTGLARARAAPAPARADDPAPAPPPSSTAPPQAPAPAPAQAGKPAPWRAIAPGVEHLAVHGDQVAADLLRFDLRRFRADVRVTGAAAPASARQHREASGASAAVNGGFFDTDGKPLGLRVTAGKTVVPLRSRVDWGVLVVRDDRAAIVHSRDYPADAPADDTTVVAALQVGPRLLIDGAPPKLKAQSARRTAVALDAEGARLTLVVTRGAVEARPLAELLARLGFVSALLLDGGPSTQLSAVVGDFRLEVPGLYPVPDALLILPR